MKYLTYKGFGAWVLDYGTKFGIRSSEEVRDYCCFRILERAFWAVRVPSNFTAFVVGLCVCQALGQEGAVLRMGFARQDLLAGEETITNQKKIGLGFRGPGFGMGLIGSRV